MTLPHGEKVLVPLQRLTRLYDGLDQLEDMFEGGLSEEGSLMEDLLTGGGEWLDGPDTGAPSQPRPFVWTLGGEADTRNVDTDENEEGEIPDIMVSGSMGSHMDLSQLDPPRFPGGLPVDDASTTPLSTTPVPHSPSTPPLTSQPREPRRDSENGDLYWKRFDVLSSAPKDHAFYDRPIPQPSRAFMVRLQKEYRALSTGLPGMFILVSMTCSKAGAFLSLNSRKGI